MEFVRSAPSVWAMSLRLTSVCGVDEVGFTVSGAPDTSTVSWCCATASAKCSSCTLPEVTVTDCCAPLNPAEMILTSYSPTGTLDSNAIPSSFVVPEVLKSDVRLCTSTWAPCTGRCCGSCTMAFTVPNTEAIAGRHESSASEIMIAIDRFNIFDSPEEPSVRVPVFLVRQQTGITPEQKYLQRSWNSRNYGRFWGQALSRDNAQTCREKLSYYFSALGCALEEGRTAI